MSAPRRAAAAAAAAAVLGAAGCGGDREGGGADPGARPLPQQTGRAAALPEGDFDARAIYRRQAPGVVTVISVFRGGRAPRGLGSGFVVDAGGEIATNAHVVTQGEGRGAARAGEVYVQFADGNQVRARIVGTDPDYDVALLRVEAARGLRLHALPLGSSADVAVGQPVAAIGSPFGERQSLSVGVISGVERTIESLTRFQIPDALQTDAAINTGNSGGPLLDARGRVVGINAQIRTAGGGSEGVGFAIPIDAAKRSLDQLREDGRARYAYVGVSTVPLYPQLARRLGLSVDQGALVQEVVPGGPAARAGVEAGDRRVRFQGQGYRAGGDAIVRVGDRPIREESDVARALTAHRPGDEIALQLVRGDERRTVRVRLGRRP